MAAGTLALGACKTMEQMQRDLALLNAPPSAAMSDAVRNYKTQVAVPNDPRQSAAFQEALPNLKKILAIHQCIPRDPSAAWGDQVMAPLRQLNAYTVPGFDASKPGLNSHGENWIPTYSTRYHNPSACLAVQAMDGITMPAANALNVRVIYISTESAEVVKFHYGLQKSGDGSWRLREFGRTN